MFSKQLHIQQTWDGQAIDRSEEISLFFRLDHKDLRLMVQAPFHGDAAPDASPGSTPGLWEYELVELFLLGDSGHYLEIELGPHGHYLLYFLSDVRQVVGTVVPLAVSCCIVGDTWRGEITIGRGDLPTAISHVNGYGIHGQGDGRRYLAATPVPGRAPDFHQPEVFLPLDGVPDCPLEP